MSESMTKYKYNRKSFVKGKQNVEIPDNAVGVTVDYFGDLAVVQYLTPK